MHRLSIPKPHVTQGRGCLTCFTICPVPCVLCWVVLLRLNHVTWHKSRLTVGSWFSKWDLNINVLLEGCSVLLSVCIYASFLRGNISPCVFSEQIFQTRWRAPTGAWKGCSCCWGASSTAWSLPASWMWVLLGRLHQTELWSSQRFLWAVNQVVLLVLVWHFICHM